MAVNQNFECSDWLKAINSPVGQGMMIAGGAALVVCLIQPATVLGFLAASVSGAIGSFATYSIAEFSYETYLHWKHRVAAPLLLDRNSPQFQAAFEQALERTKDHPQYPFFRESAELNTDDAVYNFLIKNLRIGWCHGSAVRVLQTLKLSPHASSPIVVSSLDIVDIFHVQLIHIMQASFKAAAANEARRQAMRAAFSPVLGPEPEQQNKIPAILAAIKEIQHELAPYKEISSDLISMKSDDDEFQNGFSALVAPDALGNPDAVYGTIEIRGVQRDNFGRPNISGHVVCFQLTQNKYRYYDTINEFDGGFFEYDNAVEFLTALQKQLINDLAQCEDVRAVINVQTDILATEPDSEESRS